MRGWRRCGGEHVGEPGLRIDVISFAVAISVTMAAAGPRRDLIRQRANSFCQGQSTQGSLGALFERQARPLSRKAAKGSQRLSMLVDGRQRRGRA